MPYQILKRKPLPQLPGNQPAEIVLCVLTHNKNTPWVTWQRNLSDGQTYWGHYFDNEAAANLDFAKRGQ